MYEVCGTKDCISPIHSGSLCRSCYMKQYRKATKEKPRIKKTSLIRAAYGLTAPLEKHTLDVEGVEVIDVDHYRDKYNIKTGDK